MQAPQVLVYVIFVLSEEEGCSEQYEYLPDC